MKLYEAEVLSRERFGNHTLIRYRWEGEPPKPGQFVMARTAPRTLDPFLSRPFFAHDYTECVASLLFEIRGRGTQLLAENSSGLLVSAPSGRGFTSEGEGPVALVGGGVWVSPLKLLSRHLRESGVSQDIFLEVPSAAPKAYADWIESNYPDAVLVPTSSSSAPRSVLARIGDLARYRAVYASGPSEMLIAVKNAAAGVTASAQLALRERMACANGSCYGCTVPVGESDAPRYARICVEGPVFPAEVVSLVGSDR